MLSKEDTQVIVSFQNQTATINITVTAVHVCVFDGPWDVITPATIFAEGQESRACQGGDGCTEVETRTIEKVVVTGITVKVQPTKTTYNEGETFDATGIKVVANGIDGSETDVTELVSYDKVMLFATDTQVIVSYLNKEASIQITVQEGYDITTVSQARQADVGEELCISGYFVGVADDGNGTQKEILLKDVENDDIIAVKGMLGTSATFSTVYSKGDLVRIWGTIALDDETNSPNKKVVDYSEDKNPEDISETIVSRDNKITYELEDTVVLTSWSSYKNFFKVSTAETYTYITFRGTMYSNRYVKGGDGVGVRRIHANSSATSLSGLKPDTIRTVSIRDNTLKANVGVDALSYFGSSTGYPGSIIPVEEITCVLTGANSAYFQLTILEESWIGSQEPEDDGTYTNQDVVVEVANAYLRQGKQIKYDQYYQRRHINISPEEATDQNILYMDCSSFVNAVYYEAFGVNVLPYDVYAVDAKTNSFRDYARDNPNASDVVGYWVNADYTTTESQDELLAQIKASLQVGDVLNYRHGNKKDEGGHVYIYIGNDQFIHCTGSSFKLNDDASLSYDNREDAGCIAIISASQLFDRANSGQKRFLFYNTASDQTVNFCVIRPLARGLTPTAETVNRMAYKGLDVEKTVAEGVNTAVYKDGTITYTAKITNNSIRAYKSIVLKEVLDSKVTFVNASMAHSLVGNELSFTLDVSSGMSVTVTWTVKVNASAETGALLVSNQTTVGGVLLATTEHTVSGYTKAQMEDIATTAKEYATSGKTFDDPILMVKELYKEVLGDDLFNYTNVSSIFGDLFVKQEATYQNFVISKHPEVKEQSEIFKMVAYGLYGGYDVSWLQWKNNEQVRLIEVNNMSLGDVIVAQDGTTTRVYVYVGGMDLVMIDTLTNTCTLKTMTSAYYAASHVLVTLPSYDFYAVLRPSMVA